jgi:hypothetical protein
MCIDARSTSAVVCSALGKLTVISQTERMERHYRPKRPSRWEHDHQDEQRPTPPGSPERSTRPIRTHPTAAVDAAKIDLLTMTTRTEDDRKPETVAVNIAIAQRLVLADLQHDIAMGTEGILNNSVDPIDIKVLGRSVKDYCIFPSLCANLWRSQLTKCERRSFTQPRIHARMCRSLR